MKRIFLLCGALWVTLRFAFLYVSLGAALDTGGSLVDLATLFALGSGHALAALGFLLASFRKENSSFLELLRAGQWVALLADGVVLYGRLFSSGVFRSTGPTVFPAALSIPFTLGVLVIDVFFLLGLALIHRDKSEKTAEEPPDNDLEGLPEVREISVEEET
ncbi:MAG: hypothetical protein JW760_02980 [Spirochaetales bacterium]|nr:hypothetical protein [Spirochaetales bacterium]